MLNKALKVLLATNGLILFAAAMLGPIYALFVEEIGGNLLDASFAVAAFALAAGITTYISGRYADTLREGELIIVLGYLIMSIGFFLYLFVNSIWFLLVVQLLIGFGEAIYSPAFDAVYSRHMSNTFAGRQWSAWEMMNYFVAAAGALIGGYIAWTFGFTSLFVVMGALSLLSAAYIYFLPRKLL